MFDDYKREDGPCHAQYAQDNDETSHRDKTRDNFFRKCICATLSKENKK